MTGSPADAMSDFLDQMHVPLYEHQRRLLELIATTDNGAISQITALGGRAAGRSIVDRLAMRFCHERQFHMHFLGRDYRRCIGREDGKLCPGHTAYEPEET